MGHHLVPHLHLLVQIIVVFPSIVKFDGIKKFLLSGNDESLDIMTLTILVFFNVEFARTQYQKDSG